MTLIIETDKGTMRVYNVTLGVLQAIETLIQADGVEIVDEYTSKS